MSKAFWAVIAIIVVIFGGILLFHSNKAAAPTNANGASPTSHTEGNGKTGVTLLEYGDYECPYCGQYYPTVKQVAAKYNDQITFQFRNLPLVQIHQNALASARAAEAAGMQGKFWEMHDLLYENQQQWVQSNVAEGIFDQYATSLGLNLTQFKSDYASDKVNNSINADINAFQKTGQEESTPTFFLDGKLVRPGNTVDAFSSLIDAEIAAKTKK
ncbi:MAG TPA: thioredoxin domain-containing protein [Candidatus Saccharimonadales bacterium]|nr:thioredoxin domain-containing protein [Candidatus Saccharimonadales bacterium]